MLKYLITCRSLTYAQRTARVLEKHGITAIVAKAPGHIIGEGCAYGVQVREHRFAEAVQAVRAAGLGPGRCFLQREDGSYKEVYP